MGKCQKNGYIFFSSCKIHFRVLLGVCFFFKIFFYCRCVGNSAYVILGLVNDIAGPKPGKRRGTSCIDVG
jgi:hypothetical protein